MKNFIIKYKYWLIFALISGIGFIFKTTNINSDFINNYLIDIIYVILLYFLNRNFISDKESFFLAFVICFFLEILKLIGIPQELLNSGNKYIEIIAKVIGTAFSMKNIAMYFIGASTSFILDKFVLERKN